TELRSALGGSDIAAIKTAQEKVARVSQEVGGALYSQQAEAGAPGAEGTDATGAAGGQAHAAGDDDVVDAEIVDEGPDHK
ncbi:MAG: molecular chaperone DnaK, partial [Blastococcus sp.]|nr:molecular chaperone DnaK [Blastococcus sp.]